MPPHVPNHRWTVGVFAVFFIIDLLMAARIVQRLVLHTAPISPDGLLFFLLLVALQVVVMRLLLQLGRSLAHYQRLKRDYEQELDLLRQVMECAEEGLSVLDELGRFVYVNAAFAALVGQSAESVVGRSIHDVLPAAPLQFWQQAGSLTVPVHGSAHLRVRSQPRWYAGRVVGHIVSSMPVPADQG